MSPKAYRPDRGWEAHMQAVASPPLEWSQRHSRRGRTSVRFIAWARANPSLTRSSCGYPDTRIRGHGYRQPQRLEHVRNELALNHRCRARHQHRIPSPHITLKNFPCLRAPATASAPRAPRVAPRPLGSPAPASCPAFPSGHRCPERGNPPLCSTPQDRSRGLVCAREEGRMGWVERLTHTGWVG